MAVVNIQSGEKYNFNMIKNIIDHGEYLEIVGNFKPRGKHETVKLYKKTITNLDFLKSIFTFENPPYYCPHCKREHKTGSVYEEHRKYLVRDKKRDPIPKNRVVKCDTDKFRAAKGGKAWRQALNLWRRKIKSPGRKDLYYYELNKLIIAEGCCLEELK